PPTSPLFPYTTLFRSDDLRAGEAAEVAQVTAEVGQQDVLSEPVQRHTGVARQPVFYDLLFFLHRRHSAMAMTSVTWQGAATGLRSEEHTSELQSRENL